MKKLAFILAAIFVFTACSSAPESVPGESCTLPEDMISGEGNLLSAPKYSTEDLEREARLFASFHRGEFDFREGGTFGPEEIKSYAVFRMFQKHNADQKEPLLDERGEYVVTEESVADFCEEVLLIHDFELVEISSDGFYPVPYDGLFRNPIVSCLGNIDGLEVVNMDFFDLDDTYCEGLVLWQTEYGFLPVEYEGEVFFRPVYAKVLAGEEH